MASQTTQEFIKDLRRELKAQGNLERATQQQAYMKSEMPYAGLTSPTLRALCKTLISNHPITDADDWYGCARELWDEAAVREERYAAISLLSHNRYRKLWYTPDALPLYRHMVETGAWWDYVDNIASNHVGQLWQRFGADIQNELESWITDEHLWVRRTAILAQLKFKDKTDLEFLDRAIQGSISDNDFFARKAIGWALRAYSYTDPAWVIDYIDKHEGALSPLSVREGMKVIVRQAATDIE